MAASRTGLAGPRVRLAEGGQQLPGRLRRKAVAAWMNILIGAAVGITVATAGSMAAPGPMPGALGI